MGQGWKYRPGDIVRHQEYDDLVGVIVQPLLVGEVDDSIPLDEPDVIHEWYLITWVITPENKYYCGRECEEVLVLVFRPIRIWGHTNPEKPNQKDHSSDYCPKCGWHFATHNDDGSCVDDSEEPKEEEFDIEF